MEIAEVSYGTDSPALEGSGADETDPLSLVPSAAVPDGLDPRTDDSFVVALHAVDPPVGPGTVSAESVVGYRILPAGTTAPVEIPVFPAAGTTLDSEQRFPPDPGGTANDGDGAEVAVAAWERVPGFTGGGSGAATPVESVRATVTGGLDQAPGEPDPVVNDGDSVLVYDPVEETFRLRAPDSDVFDGGSSVSQPEPGTLELTADRQEAGTTTTVGVPATDLLSDPGLSLLSLSITFEEAASIDLTVSAGAPDGGFSTPDGFDSLGFFSVDHPAPTDGAVESVRFGFSVDSDAIDDPRGLVLFRQGENGVQSLSTQLVSETPTAYHYGAVSPGLSTFGAGVQSSSSDSVENPNDPKNQLWVTLGVPTLLNVESNRPVNGADLPDIDIDVNCQNNANAPIMISESYDSENTGYDLPVVDDPPGWLPGGYSVLDGSKAYHRVPAVLNVRQTGDIDEEIAVNIPTTDALDGSLVAVNDREGDVGNDDAIGGLGFTFSSEEYSERALTRKLDLIFVSEGRCNRNTTQSTILDNIGNLSVSVKFTEGDSTWTEITGSDTHQHGLSYYTPGRSLTEASRELANDAMQIWAEKTVSAIMPGGPVRMYRAARAVGGAAPLAGPAVELMALWEGIDGVFSDVPLTPSSVLSSAINKVAFGGAGDLSGDRFPDFFPGLSNAGVSETEIGIYGPALYFSGERDTSESGYAAEYYNHTRDHPDFEQGSGFGSSEKGLVEPELTGEAPQLSSKGESANQISQFDWWDRQYLSRTRIDDSIDFSKSDFPLDEGEPLDPNLAAAHWEAIMTVPDEGEYEFRTRSDDDSWVFVDGSLVVDNGGLHPSRTETGTVELDGGEHRLDVFFAERQTVGLEMEFEPPGDVEIRPP